MEDKKPHGPKKPRVALWAAVSAVLVVLTVAGAVGTYVAFGSTQAINIAL